MADTTTPNPDDATSTKETVTTTVQTTDELGEGGRKALAAERKRADEAEKLARKLQADAYAAAAAKAKADEEDAIKKGEFERLANERADALKAKDSEIATLTAERDALQERLQTYEANVAAEMDAWIKANKDAIPAYLNALHPGENASLDDRRKWLDAARQAVSETPKGGVPRTPNPATGNDTKADEAAKAAASAANRSRF